MTEFMELTDDEEKAVEAEMANPLLIKTVERAEEIIEFLDEDIEGIKEQLEAAKIEAEVCGSLPSNRQDWVRRASRAIMWKKRSRAAVLDRAEQLTKPPEPDKQIESIVAMVARRAEREANRVREQEILLQRQREKEAARLKRIEAANRQNIAKAEMFVKAAHSVLDQDDINRIWEAAKSNFPDNPAWEALPKEIA